VSADDVGSATDDHVRAMPKVELHDGLEAAWLDDGTRCAMRASFAAELAALR
jgi:hypothetical protein